MMIGLVALLGAKAEAHYYVASGKYKYCSVCSETQLTPQDGSIDSDPHTEKLKFVLTPKLIEILCPNEQIPISIDDPLLQNLSLEVQKTIDAGDITTLLNGNGGPLTTAEVTACVNDAALLVNSTLDQLWDQICGVDVIPTAVIIRNMKAEINTLACDVLNTDVLNTCDTVSTHVDDDCTLPKYSNLKNYPNKPKEAYYKCE
ncbi:MAG: hypothetical protein M3461_07330 [Pseudomonadota bacterium]|nr:hypothetical protein [Pseudomonadota bacterium]